MTSAMINGTHILFYSTDADADRAFLRDVLGFHGVDAGGGWLIFKMPAAEAAMHPAEAKLAYPHGDGKMLGAAVFFMCDDVRALVRTLDEKNVKCEPIEKERWGLRTAITLPSGGQIGLYQPTHPTALDLK
ncbi:MAG TPA: VOC family protein [Candidatus Acidoferrales bacterium]|nr:VOC family protein [Candidatus Acidoferrales bacterium]